MREDNYGSIFRTKTQNLAHAIGELEKARLQYARCKDKKEYKGKPVHPDPDGKKRCKTYYEKIAKWEGKVLKYGGKLASTADTKGRVGLAAQISASSGRPAAAMATDIAAASFIPSSMTDIEAAYSVPEESGSNATLWVAGGLGVLVVLGLGGWLAFKK